MPPMPRRFQFSLRALLVATLLAAIFFGGIVVGREWGRHEATVNAANEAVISAEAERRWMLKHYPALLPGRPRLSLKTLLWSLAVVASLFAGIHLERERRRLADERAAKELRARDPFAN